MPAYQFEAKLNGEVVARVLLPLAVNDRDKVEWTRCQIPDSVTVSGSAGDPDNQSSTMMRAYHRAECRQGSSTEFFKKLGHTPEQIKQVWAS